MAPDPDEELSLWRYHLVAEALDRRIGSRERGLIVRGPLGYDIYTDQQIGVLLFGDKLLGDRAHPHFGLRRLLGEDQAN